jgi:2-phosphoglycerate kinase
MAGMAREPSLVLVTGLPGTGKSTVAKAIAQRLDTAVLAHDWAMSGLRPFSEVQVVLDDMGLRGHRTVGWSILNALARLQLRSGRSIVLDGVARAPEIDSCRSTAHSEAAWLIVIATYCSDLQLHRSRVEGRQRLIPNWYELDWGHAERSIESWEQPDHVDLTLDAASNWEHNLTLIDRLLEIKP